MPLYKHVSLMDIPPLSRLQELEYRRKQIPTTNAEYGWFHEKKHMLWQFYPWTQMANMATSPSYYKAVYDRVLNNDKCSSMQDLTTVAVPVTARTNQTDAEKYCRETGNQTERPVPKLPLHDTCTCSYANQPACSYSYRKPAPAVSDGNDAAFLRDIRSVQLTTRDNRQLQFNLCDHASQPPPFTSRF
jgi:hypothetical protein